MKLAEISPIKRRLNSNKKAGKKNPISRKKKNTDINSDATEPVYITTISEDATFATAIENPKFLLEQPGLETLAGPDGPENYSFYGTTDKR